MNDMNLLFSRTEDSLLPSWNSIPDFGLYMDQLTTFVERALQAAGPGTELTKSMVNNYVKCGLVSKPKGKTYSRESIAQLLMICWLKQAVGSIDLLQSLLHPQAGASTEDLYHTFCAEQQAWLAHARQQSLTDPLAWAMQSASSLAVCRMLLESDGEHSTDPLTNS